MVGFNSKNIAATQSMYKCPHCSLLLRDAVQIIDCGHRLCQSCVDDQQGDVITCSECQQKTPREGVKPDRGFRNDTQKLSITCSLCEWNGILKNYQNHLDQTHPNPGCNYCNQKLSSVNDLNRHQKYTCDIIPIDCPLKSMGCEEKFARVDAANHYLTDRHQNILVNFIRQKFKIHQHPMANVTVDQDETINVLLNDVGVLSNCFQGIGIKSSQLQNMLQPIIQDLPNIKKSIDEQNALVDHMKKKQELYENEIPSAKQQLEQQRENIKPTKHDGTMIWKITDVKEKRAAAKFNSQTWIDSPPFYSSLTGYKMCLRLYFDGNDVDQGTHMSLYFVLMRGEFDAILRFPFYFKVKFRLYDQSGEENHITNVFTPDVRSDSFQRPRSDMNTACGKRAFVSLTKLQLENTPYIRDDTMFIEVMIDFLESSPEISSHASGLSPAITTETHQDMTQQVIEERQQSSVSTTANNEINTSIDTDSQETHT